MNQRWRQRRDTYRPAGELINTRSYEIVETNSDRIVREFIALHHYLQTVIKVGHVGLKLTHVLEQLMP